MGERQSIAQKGVRAIDARNSQLEMAQVLQKPVFALPGCQQMSVNTLLCDTLALADTVSTSLRAGINTLQIPCDFLTCLYSY